MPLYPVLMKLRIPLTLRSDAARERCIEHLLTGLALVNLEHLRENPNTPPLYRSGVIYWDDPESDTDDWLDIPSVLAVGKGDCDDLVPWRLAELWAQGERNAKAMAVLQRRGDTAVFHALIRRQHNTEDPSAILGMKR